LQLADVNRELGRISDAERSEARLRKWLEFADADHPIRLALAQRNGSFDPKQKNWAWVGFLIDTVTLG
jgi:hypothetical protein